VQSNGCSGLVGVEPVVALGMEDEQGSNAGDHEADGDPEQITRDFFGIKGRHRRRRGQWVRCVPGHPYGPALTDFASMGSHGRRRSRKNADAFGLLGHPINRMKTFGLAGLKRPGK
jgi:hypothetical protein